MILYKDALGKDQVVCNRDLELHVETKKEEECHLYREKNARNERNGIERYTCKV